MLRRHILDRRITRFALIGVACAALQIALVAVFEDLPIPALLLNAAAFAVAAQLNFVLSSRFTWSDRASSSVLWRWLAFLGAIAGTAAVNMGVFVLARSALGDVAASAAGIAVAAVLNFVIGDRAIFRAVAAADHLDHRSETDEAFVPVPRGVFRP